LAPAYLAQAEVLFPESRPGQNAAAHWGLAPTCSIFTPTLKLSLRIDGQSTMAIELEDGLRKPWEVKSNLFCAAGTGGLPEQ